MRFVAKYQKYSAQARVQREVLTVDGYPMVAQEQILCDFEQGSLRPYEIDAGISQLGARRGLPDGIDPSYRLSVFDTEWAQKAHAWDGDTREFVEQVLLNNPSLGVDYILVEEPKIAAPWPRYDEVHELEHLIAKIVEDGFDIGDVIAYEKQNQDRPDVLAALELEQLPAPDAPAEILA